MSYPYITGVNASVISSYRLIMSYPYITVVGASAISSYRLITVCLTLTSLFLVLAS